MVTDSGHASASASGPTPAPEYLTADEVGKMLKLSGKSIYRVAAQDPTMPVLRIGGSLRFPRARLLRWLDDRTQGARRMRHQMRPLRKLAPDKERPS